MGGHARLGRPFDADVLNPVVYSVSVLLHQPAIFADAQSAAYSSTPIFRSLSLCCSARIFSAAAPSGSVSGRPAV